MVITLGEASRRTGKSKAAITKAIGTGRLSAAKSETGDWQIDPARISTGTRQTPPDFRNPVDTGPSWAFPLF
jgi:hypothetical protein